MTHVQCEACILLRYAAVKMKGTHIPSSRLDALWRFVHIIEMELNFANQKIHIDVDKMKLMSYGIYESMVQSLFRKGLCYKWIVL